jgi:hypothetical protein
MTGMIAAHDRTVLAELPKGGLLFKDYRLNHRQGVFRINRDQIAYVAYSKKYGVERNREKGSLNYSDAYVRVERK